MNIKNYVGSCNWTYPENLIMLGHNLAEQKFIMDLEDIMISGFEDVDGS